MKRLPSTRTSINPESAKSTKSVAYIPAAEAENQIDTSGMLIESTITAQEEKNRDLYSISTRIPWPERGHSHLGSGNSLNDLDLWLAFLTETGLMHASELKFPSSDIPVIHSDIKVNETEMMLREMDIYKKSTHETVSTTVRDDYEGIHRLCPGLFWDTIMMDDSEAAYIKAKKIVRDIVNSQNNFEPMFDVDFANIDHYPTVEKRLANIRKQIAPQRLFF